jgi:cytoskeletal protein CcmA (bactofilin family)
MGLFAKDRPDAASAVHEPGDHETSFFGTKLSIKGKVSGAGNVIVMGKLEGEFDLNGELVVAPSALVSGEVKAISVTVSGGFSGTLTALEKIHIEKSAVVSGRLLTSRLSMVDGAIINGEIEMKKPSESELTPKGPSQKGK